MAKSRFIHPRCVQQGDGNVPRKHPTAWIKKHFPKVTSAIRSSAPPRPAIERAGWNGIDQIYREFPLRAGRVVVRGKTAQRDKSTVLRADYALFFNRTVEAIANGQNRMLLVMATGTGKTYTAFQIIHRLWKSPWRADKPSGQKRILFLADRNILIDQTMVSDFRPFKGAMAKLSPHAKGVERVPDHFAILNAPDDVNELRKRDQFLASHGISPIWYGEGDWAAPGEILKLLKQER